MNQRTSVGLDVHARSVVACGLDGRTGELFERRLTPDHRDILEWIRSLPDPVKATYEAGPTGSAGPFPEHGRHRVSGGGTLEAAAPVRRSGQDRRAKCTVVARLLYLDQINPVMVPRVAQEAA